MTQYTSKYETQSGTESPLPEPSDISQAAALNFDDLLQELNRLHAALEGCELCDALNKILDTWSGYS